MRGHKNNLGKMYAGGRGGVPRNLDEAARLWRLAAGKRPAANCASRDGTVLLHFRATGLGGMIGDALLRYPPSDPNYPAVRGPLPTLRLGDGMPVLPFK